MIEKYCCADCAWREGCTHAETEQRLPKQEGGLGLCLKDRAAEDLGYGHMIWVRLPDGPLCHHLTMTEYEWLRRKFEQKAAEELKTSGADHVVYGTKSYRNGKLTTASLFILPLDEAEFEKRTASLIDEHVYALHAIKT